MNTIKIRNLPLGMGVEVVEAIRGSNMQVSLARFSVGINTDEGTPLDRAQMFIKTIAA